MASTASLSLRPKLSSFFSSRDRASCCVIVLPPCLLPANKLPAGPRGGAGIEGTVGEKSGILAGNDGVLEHLREFPRGEARGANHVLGVDVLVALVLDLTGRQHRLQQAPVGQIPPVAADDDADEQEDGE